MMKSVFLTLLVLCLVQAVLASEVVTSTSTKVPVKEGYETLDMTEYNKQSAAMNAGSGSKVVVTTSCTDTVGKTHKQGELGYDSCLINAGNKGNSNSSQNQMNVNFGK